VADLVEFDEGGLVAELSGSFDVRFGLGNRDDFVVCSVD